jgi:hypothetical protein
MVTSQKPAHYTVLWAVETHTYLSAVAALAMEIFSKTSFAGKTDFAERLPTPWQCLK